MIFVQTLLLLTLSRVCSSQVVATNNGKVQGTTMALYGTTLHVHRGIPYAQPPIDTLRFKKPEPVADWSPTKLYATALKPACIQIANPIQPTERYRQLPTPFDEDCLYLNIWAPQGLSNRPVFVWLHGGGFYSGSATIGLYDGKYVAAFRKVVMVTVNYRLGPLGFSRLGADTIPGNMGLWDQQLALKWIMDNIKAFGGDPTLITLFGQDAGAASIGFHMLAPSSHDLFNRAILQSGSPSASWMYNDAMTGRYNTRELGKKLGCPVNDDDDLLECFNNANIQDLADMQFQVMSKGLPFLPIVDEDFIPEDPMILIKSANFKNTSIIHGVVEDEATLILLPWLLNVLGVTSPPSSVSLTEAQYMTLLNDFLNRKKEPLNGTLLTTYYVDGELPLAATTNYLEALNLLWSDIDFKCPAVEFASHYSMFNSLYQYSFEHRISVSPYPSWVGVAHSYELEMVFGLVLDSAYGFTNLEKALSRNIIKYWVNFGKSGAPNGPDSVSVKWPLHEATKKYLIQGTGSNLAVSAGLRNSQCVFINQILPLHTTGAGERVNLAWSALLLPLLVNFVVSVIWSNNI